MGNTRPSPRSHERGPVEAWANGSWQEPRESHLRALTSAAPLKQGRPASAERRAGVSPRSHERGPVEARLCGWSCSRSKSRSPRSHERGPVEAVYRCFLVLHRCPYLRALTSAAPLKLFGAALNRAAMTYLRALTSAAPLKRRAPHRQPHRPSRSPRSHERGPVEARRARALQWGRH